jgi:hypothetical protein
MKRKCSHPLPIIAVVGISSAAWEVSPRGVSAVLNP